MYELSKELSDRICALYDGGQSAPSISAVTDVPAYRVREELRARGYRMQGGSRSELDRMRPQVEELLPLVTDATDLARRLGRPPQTVRNWLSQMGIDPGSLQATAKGELLGEAARLAGEGLGRAEIARTLEVPVSALSQRMTRARISTHGQGNNRRAWKKDHYFPQVLRLHEAGKTVHEIADELPVGRESAATWLKQEGYQPRYVQEKVSANYSPEISSHPQYEDIVRRYMATEAEWAIASELAIDRSMVRKILLHAEVMGQGGRPAKAAAKAMEACQLYRAGKTLDKIIRQVRIDYYALRIALDGAGLLAYPDDEKPDFRCPCGKLTGSPNRRFCGPAHRREFGKKTRVADPANTIEAICRNPDCLKPERKFEHPRSQARVYCGDPCSQQHQREDEKVNGLERRFLSLTEMMGIVITRGSEQVPFGTRGSYGPDFTLTWRGERMWAETKAGCWIKSETAPKHAAWRAQRGRLVMIFEEDLQELRVLPDAQAYWDALKVRAIEQEAG